MKSDQTVAPPKSGSSPRASPQAATPFEYKSAAGYAVAVLLSLVLGITSIYAQRFVALSRDRVDSIYAGEIVELGRLRAVTADKASDGRAYLLTGNPVYLKERAAALTEFHDILDRLASQAKDTPERSLVEEIQRAQEAHHEALEHLIKMVEAGEPAENVARTFEQESAPRMAKLESAIEAFGRSVDIKLRTAREDAVQAASHAARLMLFVPAAAMALALGLGLLFFRTIKRPRRASDERMAALEGEVRARIEAEIARTELAKTVLRLEQVNADLDAFAGRVAHDLRNVFAPLSLASARLQRLTDASSLPKLAASIDRTIRRASAVLDGLLAFSRAGCADNVDCIASVKKVVTDVVEELSPLAAEAKATLSIEIEDAQVVCSPPLLHIVLLNLLSNAIKYIGESDRREVRVRVSCHDKEARISVEDTGPGIPEEAIERIFEPFFRVPGTRAAGTGIGLATVKRIVDAHRGRVACLSTIGEGATFLVFLPRVCLPPSD
jgi:signal transduction histidine kinase